MSGPHPVFSAEQAAPPAFLSDLSRRSFIVGIAGLLACGAGWVTNHDQLTRSWLPAYFVWLGVALGSLAVLMLQAMTRGSWGIVMRRPLEAATRTIPFLIPGILPILFGMPALYPWARPDAVAASHALQHQHPWMNPQFAIGRAVLFFVIWWTLGVAMNRLSLRQDRDGDPFLPTTMQKVAAPGLIAYALSVTFFGFDWLMSVNTDWYSSIFGFYMMASQALAAFAFVVVVLWLLARRDVLPEFYQARHLHDIGKLLFAFVLVWAYFSVSQFLIIWSGNLPEEISWYLVRMGPAWKLLSLIVVLLHFALPFGLLLSADRKKDLKRLGPVALLLLVMRWVDIFWQVAPGLSPGRFTLHWLDLAAFVGIGGVFTGLFFWQLARRALVPVNDPALPEALTQHG